MVLVIDDEKAIRRNFRSCLEDTGYRVTEAADGREGLEVFSQDPADIVLTDLRMPGMGGLEFITALKQISPGTPVVAVSGTGTLPDAIEAIRQGAWDYMVKPITEAGELDVIIRRNIERADLLAENLRHREQLEMANKELESFSYSVSHDLQAPLRRIDGFTQILTEDYGECLNERGKEFLFRIRKEANQMAQLIRDLLSLARIGRGEVRRTSVDVGALARTIIDELRKQEPDRQVEVSISDGLSATADANLLRIVLENLLGNAWKFTRRRTRARIELGVETCPEGRVYYVRDNGAGFDMAYADKLFGAFQRLHPAGEFEGTGIGLAIVQRIIHRHGGRVWARSEVDQGATFFFTLESGKSTAGA